MIKAKPVSSSNKIADQDNMHPSVKNAKVHAHFLSCKAQTNYSY